MIIIIITGNSLTSMTISLYKHLVVDLTPTPAKMHYIFNLRDVSKVQIT